MQNSIYQPYFISMVPTNMVRRAFYLSKIKGYHRAYQKFLGKWLPSDRGDVSHQTAAKETTY